VPARALIVDDEALIRSMMRRALARAGFDVVEAAGVTAAIDALTADRFDVLTTDLKMPGRNGAELIEWAREHRPELRILCVSAFADDVELRVPVLAKPFSGKELIAALDRLLAS